MAAVAFDSLPAWSPRRHAAGWAAGILVVTALGLAGGVAALLLGPDVPEIRGGLITSMCYLVPYGLVGAFLLSRRPDLPFGWLLAGATVAITVSVLASDAAFLAVSAGEPGAWPAWAVGLGGLQFTAIAVQGFVNVRFPSGRIETRWGRVLDRLMLLGLVAVVVGGVLTAADSRAGTEAPTGVLLGAAPLIVLLGLLAGLRIVVRARHATGIERQQLRWRAVGVLASLALFPFAVAEVLPGVVDVLDGLVFVATLAVPVVWYRLWEIDVVIRRSMAYALVTVLLAGAYVAVGALVAAVASERLGVVVAAVVVVIGLGPVRSWSMRLVDRLFYGHRGDPYQAMREVGRRLEAVEAPGTVLTAVVAAVAESLRLPFVAIEGPGDAVLLAAHGDATGREVERWPLMYQSVCVGTLLASPRPGEDAFDALDRVILEDLARQSGAAVHAEALTADLVDSRQRLVTAREEERRRLRRDLHDGLGPLLTALGLNLDAARARLETEGANRADLAYVDALLTQAKETSSRAIVDLRSVVHGLRPPALDDLGLVGAVAAHAARLSDGSGTRVVVEAADIRELPAAVEVAAFRIVVEAITNVVRHAQASRCRVRLRSADPAWLVVEVTDNGPGSGTWSGGVGLQTMQERAAEVGGTVTAGPTPDGGRVDVRLPLGTRSFVRTTS